MYFNILNEKVLFMNWINTMNISEVNYTGI